MAIAHLSTNYKDDILDTSVNENKRYEVTETATEGVYEFEDVTEYIQKGTDFGSADVNATNSAVNAVIDLAEANKEDIDGLIDGTIAIAKATSATTATTATTAGVADSATTAEKLKNARKINGVDFDGTQNITVYDNTKLPIGNDFIVANQQTLNFVNNVCTITDARITANSLAEVFFTSATINVAEASDIVVETYNGYLTLTASTTPTGTIVASIHVKVA